MIAKEDNLLVKVIKKAAGLPIAGSSCGCGMPAAKANDCCNAEATESSSTKCGCESNGTQQPEEQPTQP